MSPTKKERECGWVDVTRGVRGFLADGWMLLGGKGFSGGWVDVTRQVDRISGAPLIWSPYHTKLVGASTPPGVPRCGLIAGPTTPANNIQHKNPSTN